MMKLNILTLIGFLTVLFIHSKTYASDLSESVSFAIESKQRFISFVTKYGDHKKVREKELVGTSNSLSRESNILIDSNLTDSYSILLLGQYESAGYKLNKKVSTSNSSSKNYEFISDELTDFYFLNFRNISANKLIEQINQINKVVYLDMDNTRFANKCSEDIAKVIIGFSKMSHVITEDLVDELNNIINDLKENFVQLQTLYKYSSVNLNDTKTNKHIEDLIHWYQFSKLSLNVLNPESNTKLKNKGTEYFIDSYSIDCSDENLEGVIEKKLSTLEMLSL